MADSRGGAPTGGPPASDAKDELRPGEDRGIHPTEAAEQQQQAATQRAQHEAPQQQQQHQQQQQSTQQQVQAEEQRKEQQGEQHHKQQGEQEEDQQEDMQHEQQQREQQELQERQQQQQEDQEQQQPQRQQQTAAMTAGDHQGTDSDMGTRPSEIGSRKLRRRNRRSSSVRVAVSGSGRLRFVSRGDSIASVLAAVGGSMSQQQQQQQQEQQQQRGMSSSERLARLISGPDGLSALSSVSCSNVAVASGQEDLAELFWNAADNTGAERQLEGMRRRRTQFRLAGDEGEDSEADAVRAHTHTQTADGGSQAGEGVEQEVILRGKDGERPG
ncbi:hypothetical protein ACSSS7_008375 [Eimeria intestinalis]